MNQAERAKKYEEINNLAAELLHISQNTLLVKLRFLDMAVSQLKLKPWDNDGVAVDGEYIYYNPLWVLKRYKSEQTVLTRDYLHMVFHCIFHHAFVGTLVDRDKWNLACDIAVEAAIMELNITQLAAARCIKERPILQKLQQELNFLTAEKNYAHFLDNNFSEQKINDWQEIFKADEHDIWYEKKSEENEHDNNNDSDSDNGESNNYQASSASGENDSADDQENNQNSQNDRDNSAHAFGAAEMKSIWKDIAERMQTDLETFSKEQGDQAGGMMQNIREVTREKYDYTSFLRQFAVLGEAMKINEDEFDYIFYTYGLKLYKNMPLIEPLEYKEVKRIKEFVIAIDTSGSVSGELVQHFIQKTYNILKQEESFFTKINLHIIQCDAEIQQDVKITSQDEFDEYLKDMQLYGFGGTDFRPVFDYVEKLRQDREFINLKGLIYFTDGWGEFPVSQPDYHTAFVFIEDDYYNPRVPVWAIKLVLTSNELSEL